jgi:hypothetical protein
LKKHSLLKTTSIIPLVIFSLIFFVPMAKASESGNVDTGDTSMTFSESGNNSDQLDSLKDIAHKKNDANDSSSSPELSLSLNEQLQWFFSVEKPDFADAPYENKDYDNYRATFGFQFILAD